MHDIAQSAHGPGHNGDLLHGLGIFLQRADQRMPHLMIGDDLSLLLAHDAVLLLLTYKHYLHRVKQILLADILPALFYGIDCRLVDHIGQVGAHRAAGGKGNGIQIHGLIHLHILRMNLQDLDTPP